MSSQWPLLLLVLLCCGAAEQWYMPDSNLISDQQFASKINEDKLSFKFVKYFTPHCPYCRYLKAVFDQLKHSKEWCFKIYDFNCQWYPQFCMNNVRSSSFPYTAIHDQTGALIEEIHGFYPEPIISTIFNRIEESCLAARSKTQPSPGTQAHPHVPETPITVASVSEPIPAATPQPASVQPVEFHEATKLASESSHAENTKPSQNLNSHPAAPDNQAKAGGAETNHLGMGEKRDMEVSESTPKQQPPAKQQKAPTQHHSQQPTHQSSEPQHAQKAHEPSAQSHARNAQVKAEQKEHSNSRHNYIFYAVCLVCAGYYVYTLHSDKQNPEVKQSEKGKPTVKVEKQTPQERSAQVEPQLTMEQSELLQHVPDQEL